MLTNRLHTFRSGHAWNVKAEFARRNKSNFKIRKAALLRDKRFFFPQKMTITQVSLNFVTPGYNAVENCTKNYIISKISTLLLTFFKKNISRVLRFEGSR